MIKRCFSKIPPIFQILKAIGWDFFCFFHEILGKNFIFVIIR
ncbi:hypothetical protein RV03_GL002237 [Enterococcus gallinarum]|nr:hypothetical protein RV03_GL002237 [Enterococcus gallinarum]